MAKLNIPISLSSQILPEYREYERFSTVFELAKQAVLIRAAALGGISSVFGEYFLRVFGFDPTMYPQWADYLVLTVADVEDRWRDALSRLEQVYRPSDLLLLRSGFGRALPRIGEGFTCHPAHILVAEHAREITNDVGHPKSFYLDRAESERFVLETCMYFPFTTAKNLTGFGEPHAALMGAFPRLQMILVLACDKAVDGNRVTVRDFGRGIPLVLMPLAYAWAFPREVDGDG